MCMKGVVEEFLDKAGIREKDQLRSQGRTRPSCIRAVRQIFIYDGEVIGLPR